MTAPRLLLIAGPSGSGKSTFLEAFLTNKLTSNFGDYLSPEMKFWPIIEANNFVKEKDYFTKFENIKIENGIILHYDTFFNMREGINNYKLDPIYKLLCSASEIYIVNIYISPEQLIKQFQERQNIQYRNKGIAKYMWAKHVRKPIKKIKKFLFGKGRHFTEDMYKNHSNIDLCYSQWNDFVSHLSATKIANISPTRKINNDILFLIN